MSEDHRSKLRQLFDQAQDLEPEALGLFLDRACSEDPGLRAEVVSLLEQSRRSREPIGEKAPEGAVESAAQVPTQSLEIGQKIGRYRIVGKLGEGGMGEVFLARDIELRRDVALKVLPARIAQDPAGLERFKREARALAAVDHPNIVTIHSVEEEDNLTFLTMERVEGDSLDQVIPEGGFEAAELADIATSIADALAFAHAKGITHRDLKPANIMVGKDGRVKILDFGLAKLRPGLSAGPTQLPTQTLTEMGIAMGTIPYMSPEQVEGKELDHRSDIFSLGIVLYEMATGQRPFAGETAPAVMSAILKDDPLPAGRLRGRLPRRLDRIISLCLEKAPQHRPQSATEVVEALERVKSDSTAVWPVSWLAALPGPPRRKAGWIAAAVLGVAIAAALVWDPAGERAAAAPIRSLAVLPLANLSEDGGQDYFVDGMTEALIADLAKVGALKVISRTSAMRYRDSDKPLPEIAQELGVDGVVEGSVMRVGERVRVTVQLIEAATDEHLWAESYDRKLRDVLSLQSEVARAIAGEIEAQLTPAELRRLTTERPVDPEAYDAYLRGLFHTYSLSPDGVARAEEYFELALEKDPEFALAYAGLSDVWGARSHWGGIPPATGLQKVEEFARRAVELDNTLAEAHNVLGKVYYYRYWDWEGAEELYLRAIELNPNYPFARMDYSLFLITMQRPEEAMAQIERALELDPLNPLWKTVRAWHLLYVGRFDEATQELRKVLAVAPSIPPAQQGLWMALRIRAMTDEAYQEGKKTFSMLGDLEVVEAMEAGYGESGYQGAMRRAAETLAVRAKQTFVEPSMISRLYAHAGENEEAIRWLQRAVEERDLWVVHLGWLPDWDGLRDDPRFRELVERVGLPG